MTLFAFLPTSCHHHHHSKKKPPNPNPPEPTLSRIEVTPADPTLVVGLTQSFSATGIYSDESRKDLTASAAWSSSNPEVATVGDSSDSKGIARGILPGSATISAAQDGMTGSTRLTVIEASLESIQVDPPAPTIAVNGTQKFTAMGTFTDKTTKDLTGQVVWESRNPAVASVSNVEGEKGLARGLAPGESEIVARDPLTAISGSANLKVAAKKLQSIAIDPPARSVPKGAKVGFVAIGSFDDGSSQDLTEEVEWESEKPGVATVSNEPGSKGQASAEGLGVTQIKATEPVSDLFGTASLEVTEARLVSIELFPLDPTVAEGLSVQFKATGHYDDQSSQDLTEGVEWESEKPGIATISNDPGSKGKATAVAPGATKITARDLASEISESTTLTVTKSRLLSIDISPSSKSVAKGLTVQFKATGTFESGAQEDLTEAVTWEAVDSAPPGVASISNVTGSKGLATALIPGTVTIRATEPISLLQDTASLEVTPAALTSIDLEPLSPTVEVGLTVHFKAMGNYDDGSREDLTEKATWTSQKPAVAFVSDAPGTKGLATAIAEGDSRITATEPVSGVKGSTVLTVLPAEVPLSIDVTPTDATVIRDQTIQFQATGHYPNDVLKVITEKVNWESEDPLVATISNGVGSKGLATGKSVGTTLITARYPSTDVSGSTSLTVIIENAAFRRCDANQDGHFDIADGIWIIDALFISQTPTDCQKAFDCNDDGFMTIADAVLNFNYNLSGGEPPAPPFPACGKDATLDPLTCESYSKCP